MSEQELITECAKEVAKEVYQDAGKPIVQPIGELFSLVPRAIKAALFPVEKWIVGIEYNLAETKKLLQQKLENIPPEQIEVPEAHIAVPTLQCVSYCIDSEELRNMYANLLASSMNKAVKNGVHPSFVEIIKQLCPDEARMLKYFYKNISIPIITLKRTNKEGLFVKVIDCFSDIGYEAKCEFPLKNENYFNNLIRLGLIEKGSHGESFRDHSRYNKLINNQLIQDELNRIIGEKDFNIPDIDKGYIVITQFGKSFCSICLDEPFQKKNGTHV